VSIHGLEQTTRYREMWYRVFGEDLEFPPPGFTAEGDRPEYRHAKREFLWWSVVSQPATAAVNSGVGIRNRATQANQSPILLVVTRIIVLGDNAAARNLVYAMARIGAIAPSGGFSLVAAVARDWRVSRNPDGSGSVPFTQAQLLTTTNGGVQGQIVANRHQPIATDYIDTLDDPTDTLLILPPNTDFIVWDNTVNELLTISFEGYVREARPEELVP
jgi:hypothetical protein